MKDKSKDHDKEKEPVGKSKKLSPPSKKLKAVSKRSAKIDVKDDEPELDGKLEEPDEDDLEPVDIEPDEDEEIDLEDDIEGLDVEAEIALPKAGKGRRSGRLTAQPGKNGVDPAKPQTRLGMIRARHEAIKREIEQIREDLDSDEEE
ncbi:MAG: hypothetical protein WCT04_00840 [Planctomycetota bacterium]